MDRHNDHCWNPELANTISQAKRIEAIVIVFACILSASSSAFSAPSSKVEVITGRIVAYSNPLMCLNGNAYWSMVIHVQDSAKVVPSEFIQIQFSLPCSESPKWLTGKSSLQKFRLRRAQDSESVLKEFMDCSRVSSGERAAESCPQLPIWKRVPYGGDDKLPFGQRLPNYVSVDFPPAPVV